MMSTGIADLRPAQHGRLGLLRPGQRVARPARLRRLFSTGKKGPSGGNSNWGSGFLPTVYQGVQFRTSGDPVLYLSNPRGVDSELAARLARRRPASSTALRLDEVGDPEIATRINSFEMAFRMQASAPE